MVEVEFVKITQNYNDGELIVRLDTGSVGLVLLIPAGSADRVWTIFPPINR